MKYTTGYKYRTEEVHTEVLPLEMMRYAEGGEIDVPFLRLFRRGEHAVLEIDAGYAWDGASGPVVDRPSNMVPSLVHDALYQLMRRGFLAHLARDLVDKIFRDMCHDRGCWRWLSNVYLAALKRYGTNAATVRRKIHEVA